MHRVFNNRESRWVDGIAPECAPRCHLNPVTGCPSRIRHLARLGALGPYHIRADPQPSLPAKPLSRGGIPLGETEKYRGLDGRGVTMCEEFPPPEECDPVL